METTAASEQVTTELVPVIVPDFSVKELLSAIPAHCFKRSALRSSLYVVWDLVVIAAIYQTTTFLDALITPERLGLPSPYLYSLLRLTLWTLYAFATGLPMFGLWVCAHECGHQAFSESETLNNAVGWVLHSSFGVPYHSWRISHAKHHAATGHLTEDQVYLARTRSELGLRAFDPSAEKLDGSSVSQEVMKELKEAVGETPIFAAVYVIFYLFVGWPAYLIVNASGQLRYPAWTNHFNPRAVIFKARQYNQIVLSDVGIFLWLACIALAINKWGFADVFRVYLAPYLCLNHWLILVTFLQHTDPLVPRYRQGQFTFQRGALSTLDRSLLGGLGRVMGYIGASTTHGISETHVLHHINSKIPHYHAWEATDALRTRLAQAGIELQGRPAGWMEMYRVFTECKFVEDEGDVVFYKNAYGQAAARPVYPERGASASDSGVELDKKDV